MKIVLLIVFVLSICVAVLFAGCNSNPVTIHDSDLKSADSLSLPIDNAAESIVSENKNPWEDIISEIDDTYESIASESMNPGEKIALVINGKNITDDNYVNYNNEYDCFELPLIAILKELGAEIKWLDEKTVSIIIYDKTYVLNTEECSLTEINSTFNLFQIAPGDTHGVFSKRVENEFVIDSDSLKLFFINELGLRMRRYSNNKEITIDALNGR